MVSVLVRYSLITLYTYILIEIIRRFFIVIKTVRLCNQHNMILQITPLMMDITAVECPLVLGRTARKLITGRFPDCLSARKYAMIILNARDSYIEPQMTNVAFGKKNH